MSRENTTKLLIETIDNAIEQAENLQRRLVIRILMMARLEAERPEETEIAEWRNDGHP
jgi:hypothetical protein